MSSDEEEPMEIVGEDGQIDLDMPPIQVPPLPPPVQSFDGSGPRLIITKIVNHNFKSYAGECVLGPFHKSFTCIIGPNGSGKSNVIDSMLFVFGYRASKIRSKKISVLIHKSEEYPNIDSCSVEVHFQKIIDNQPGEDGFEEVPNSTFVVSRSAFHDNSSFYQINGKRATYKEVGSLLKEYGIDLDHNRFLILQGEVEQIALMKPKAPTEHEDGLLEYLEDIIGSSRYKNPIAQLFNRVEKLNDYRQEKLNRVKVVEREKADLESIRNEAIDYLKLCNQVVRKKNVLFQKYILECESTSKAAEETKKSIDDKMHSLQEEMKALKDEIKEKLKVNKEAVMESEKLLKAYNDGKERFAALEREDAKLRNDLKFTNGNLKKLKSQKDEEEKKIEDLTRVPEEAKTRLEDMETKLEKLQGMKVKEEENLQRANEIAERDTQVLKKEKSEKEAKLASFQSEINEKKSELKLAQSELQNMLSVYETERQRFEEATQKKEEMENLLQQRSEDISNIQKTLPKAEQSLKQVTRDLEQVASKEHEMNNELRTMRVKLEEHKSSFQATRSHNKVINALMDLKAKGHMPGIVGRLGDLGAIDDRYDVAISTACGALDNIVTDTIDTAQKCVQYLKKHNIGHATFIGLDKMEVWRQRASQRIDTPEDSHRLFDLIKFKNDQVVTAFYYALRDTLVAKDLEQATRISYGARRFRVVTLQGQLIETSGAMTGGGNQVLRGRMGNQVKESVDPKEVDRLEKAFEAKNGECQRLRMNRARLEEANVRLNREVTTGRQSLDQYSMEVDRLRADITAFAKSIKTSEAKLKNVKPDQRQVERLEKKIPQLKTAFDKVNDGALKLKKEVDALHQKIVDVIGERVGTVQSRLDLVNADLDSQRKQMTKVRVSVKTAERNLSKAKDKVQTIGKEIEESTVRLADIQAKLKDLESEADTVIGAFRSAQKEGKAIQSVVNDQKKQIEELEAAEVEKKKEEVNIKHELDQVRSVLDENARRIRHWNKEISKLKLYYIEEEMEEAEGAAGEKLNTSISMREQALKLPKFNAEQLEEKQVEQVDITSLEDQLKAMKPNMAAIEEYRRKEELYLHRVTELEQVTTLRDEQRKQRETLKKQRLDEFMSGFHAITCKLKEMYQMITLGGDAELELVDSLDPFAEGIVFSVRPPKKSWKNISNLSGGEKTLSSLALVFALHHFKPTPLYVMDEIDAALDFKNVSIVANYIKTRTKNAQFVIISLRSNMFEMADRLVGIYKTFNCTQTITVNPKLFHYTTGLPLENSENAVETS